MGIIRWYGIIRWGVSDDMGLSDDIRLSKNQMIWDYQMIWDCQMIWGYQITWYRNILDYMMCLLCYAFKSGQVIWAQKEPRISWSCCVISHLCWSFWPIPISIIIWTEHEIMRYIVTMFYRPHQSYYTTGSSEQTGDARRRSRCSKKPEPEWWALRLVIIKLFPPQNGWFPKMGVPQNG